MLISLKFRKVRKLKNVIFLLALLKLCFIFGQDLQTKNIIVIDPGHGGKDTGAIGANNIQEKDVALRIAKEIIILNHTLLNNKFEVYSTRYKDTLISLSKRSRLAKNLKADIFVSLHCNATKVSSRGIEVYVHHSSKHNIKESIALSLSVLNEITQKLGFKKRGIKFADFQVIRKNTILCPAILVEMGFITNLDEADYFLKTKNIRAIALAILLGIINYLNTIL